MSKFDPEKYYGTWYEVARVPNVFQSDVCWIPRTAKNCTQTISPSSDKMQSLVVNKIEYEYKSVVARFLMNKGDTMTGTAWFDGNSSFSMFFDSLLAVMTFIMQLVFLANRSVVQPESPNYHIRRVIENSRGEYEYALVTGGPSGQEKMAWVMSKRHPETFSEKHKKVIESLIETVSSLGFNSSEMIRHSSIEKSNV